MKKILYIHGYNSSGTTGKSMQEIFKKYFPQYEVLAPKISPIYSEAKQTIDNVINENDIALVIGTSLGGFDTLMIDKPVLKLIINPTLDPFGTLPKIDAPKEHYESYRDLDYKSVINGDIQANTYGIFGNRDKVVNFRDEFRKNYLENHVFILPELEHQIKYEEIEKDLVPLVDYLLN